MTQSFFTLVSCAFIAILRPLPTPPRLVSSDGEASVPEEVNGVRPQGSVRSAVPREERIQRRACCAHREVPCGPFQ